MQEAIETNSGGGDTKVRLAVGADKAETHADVRSVADLCGR